MVWQNQISVWDQSLVCWHNILSDVYPAIVAHDGIEDVAPAAHLDPAYAQAFAQAQAAGVEVLALGMQITLEESLSDAGQPLWRARLGLTRALPLHDARFAG